MDGYGQMMSVTGPVSIQLAHEELRDRNTHNVHLILLLGPTGSGKSTFMECIGNDRSIQISGDQLDGVTQGLAIYRLNNVFRLGGLPIYLMDTPGFADDQFPETKILRMIQSFLEDYQLSFIKRIIYFSPITDTRVTSSRGKILKILKAITGLSTEDNITIVTTMWDQLWREDQITRANKRFEELKRVYWRSFADAGSPVVKFENNHDSAMEALLLCMNSYHVKKPFVLDRMLWDKVAMSHTTAGSLLYQNLLERRSGLQQRARNLDDGLVEEDPLVCQVLLEERESAMAITRTVEQELVLLGRPASLVLNFAEIEHSEEPSPVVLQRPAAIHRQPITSPRSRVVGGWAFKVRQFWRMLMTDQRQKTRSTIPKDRGIIGNEVINGQKA